MAPARSKESDRPDQGALGSSLLADEILAKDALSSLLSAPADELGWVFKRSLPIIRSALISSYRLTEDEVADTERNLEIWLRRLARRGPANLSARSLRFSLLAAACYYAHSLQLRRFGGKPSEDKSLDDVLVKEPRDVANYLVRCFDEEQALE